MNAEKLPHVVLHTQARGREREKKNLCNHVNEASDLHKASQVSVRESQRKGKQVRRQNGGRRYDGFQPS